MGLFSRDPTPLRGVIVEGPPQKLTSSWFARLQLILLRIRFMLIPTFYWAATIEQSRPPSDPPDPKNPNNLDQPDPEIVVVDGK